MLSASKLATHAVWYLEGFLEKDGPLRRLSIAPLPFQVGRRTDLALTIPLNSISKLHAEFRETNGELVLADLDSTNGTFVNGERLSAPRVIKPGDIVHFASLEFRLTRQTGPDAGRTIQENPAELVSIFCQFDQLFEPGAVLPFVQPIVDLPAGRVVGFELLGRSRVGGFEYPGAMFETAQHLGVQGQLSRLLRREGLRGAVRLSPDYWLFVNTHPVELVEPGLIESLRELRADFPNRNIVLEIHEAAVTRPTVMRELRAALSDLNIRLAYDDFGAGQARLTDLAEMPPDYLKFDISLVRGIHEAPETRQQLLASLVKMVRELNVAPLAEGVECQEETDVCTEIGFQFAQGYHHGRPSPVAKYVGLFADTQAEF